MTDSTPAPEQKSEPERPSINLKIFGQELGIDGVHGVWAFAFTVVAGIGVVLFLLGVYPQTAEVIGKNFFGGGSRGAHDGQVSEKGPRERVFFWIGENDNYAQNVRRFEDWLTESFDWWGKQSLISVLGIHFALVSPTFGFRGCDDRRLGPCRGPARAAPPAGAVGRKAGHEPANGGD